MTEYQEHFAHLLQLLKEERAEDRKQYELKIRNRSVQDRRKDGVTWFPVTIVNSNLGTGERWTVQVERTQETERRHQFQVGASVSLFLYEEKITRSVNGVVSRMGDNTMRIVLNKDEPPPWLYDGKIGVDLLFDESTYDEMEKTMRLLGKAEEGRIVELIPILLGKKTPSFQHRKEINSYGLNDSQNRALSLVDAAEDLALLHGPPGTGKTTTIVQSIKNTLEKERQVLVCAASNAAVDLLVEKLHVEDVRVLRLGHPGRVDEEVVSHTIDVQLTQHADAKMLKDLRKRAEEMRGIGLKYKRKFGREEKEQRRMLLNESKKLKEDARMLEGHMIHQLLQESQVIACTLIGANTDYLRGRRFTTLFIDEASQALEPASWVPIMKADRVIMAGDHQQLPPTVKSKEAGGKGLSETIFERTINSHKASQMLQVQYRMDPLIASFSNQFFYGSNLADGDVIEKRKQLFSSPVQFIDTAGCGFSEEVNPETLSTFNTEQAVFTLKMLDSWLQENPMGFNSSIGIIAPYKAHLEVLRSLIRHYSWYNELQSQITINSVDAFQGQERDVIFLDLVRSNDRGEIGFLSDIRRTNVALTRARFKLMVLGDSSTLSSLEFYDEMIGFYQARNCYHSAFEFLY